MRTKTHRSAVPWFSMIEGKSDIRPPQQPHMWVGFVLLQKKNPQCDGRFKAFLWSPCTMINMQIFSWGHWNWTMTLPACLSSDYAFVLFSHRFPNQLQDEEGNGQSSNNARHAARAAHEKLINKQSDALSALNALLAYEQASNKAAFCRYATFVMICPHKFEGCTVSPVAKIIGVQLNRSTCPL